MQINTTTDLLLAYQAQAEPITNVPNGNQWLRLRSSSSIRPTAGVKGFSHLEVLLSHFLWPFQLPAILSLPDVLLAS